MLKLDRLQISGFKSFVDPTSLEFAGELTSIVGPNGCGKSNLADAVIWVLGERSAKSLRGSKMEDVIFSGARNRQPLGMAEVTLELVTDPDFEAAEEGRLSIGRRVFRSGESQYFLNGRTVRLKDVKDLLMGTGLGLRAYSMIEQGQIGMILSGKPQDRRRLLEEAAGITRYKDRRRVAEIKLEESRANLERLDDIISEIERSLRSLKRQASSARRYQKKQAEHRELLDRVLRGRWGRLRRRLAESAAAIGTLQEREAELTAGLHRREAALTAGREELEAGQQRLSERHRREAELAALIEGKQEFLKGSRHRLEEIGERLAAGRGAETARRERLGELDSRLEEIAERGEELAAERDLAASEVDEDSQKMAHVEKLVGEAGERLEGIRARLLSSIADLTGARNRLHAEQLEREKGGLRRRHLVEELERKGGELEELEAATKQAADRADQLERAVAGGEKTLSESSSALARLEERQGRGEAERDRLESRLLEMARRRDILDELAEADRERRLDLERALAEAGLEAPRFLADALEVPEGWAESLDLYLGNLADAVVLPAEEDGLSLARALAAVRGTGRLLRPADEETAPAPAIADAAIRSSLGEALRLPAALAAALPPAYLVESPDDAERLARRHPGVAFVSRERLWAQAGVLHVQGDAARPGLLARERELAELATSVPPLEAEVAAVAAELASLAADAARRQESVRGEERELAERRQERAVAAARREDLDARLRRLRLERETLETELAEVDRELERLAERGERQARELARIEGLHTELEGAFDRAQTTALSAREERETARTGGVGRRGRLELLEERLASHRQEVARVEAERAEMRRQRAAWEEERERLERRSREIETAVGEAETALQEALEQRDASQQEVLSAQAQVDDRRASLLELETAVAALRDERDGVRSEIGEARVAEASIKQDAAQLQATYREDFESDLPEAEAPGEPVEDLEEVEAELARCRDILERLGPVNLLAAQEQTEQEERHGFLAEQRADVATSVESLKKTIREIDVTSSERFAATFEQVNTHFRELFTDLFRGGAAEMRLLDEENVLDSGIEIVARPPGKRLQNIMLLSGGEKALTAIALIFALFRTKPSPFCILDEVDAPLDDLNTLRFLDLVKRMSRETQFVMITHNKLTMEAASRLYGVTMQEQGVSDLVAVELDDVQPEPVAAAALA